MKPDQPPSAIAYWCALLCIPLSGALVVAGALAAGHDPSAPKPFPDLRGMMYFVLGAVFCPLLALCVVRLLRGFFGKKPHFLISTLVLPSLIAFPSGVLLHRAKVRDDNMRAIRQARHDAYWRVKKPELLAELAADPAIALRNRWYGQADHEKNIVFTQSLREQQVPYTPTLLDQIYQVAPDSREDVLAHPACDLPFLEKVSPQILRDPYGGRLLFRLVTHPAASRQLLIGIEKALASRTGEYIPPVREVLDARLRGEYLVLHTKDSLRVELPDGELVISASRDVLRGYQWDNVTWMATLASATAAAPGDPDRYFRASSRSSGQAGVTRLGEFREGIRQFGTMEEAAGWLGKQSAEIPTNYRNDGLVVSSSMDDALNLLTVEVWQILVDGEKPSLIPGARDSALISEKTRR